MQIAAKLLMGIKSYVLTDGFEGVGLGVEGRYETV
jgi:hypothetical protein